MAALRKLASQTAYYGLSSILGRMLNYALVPLHTRVLLQQQDYGIVGELYAYVSFLNIIFLYGMETAFFRFASRSDDSRKYYSTSFTSVLISAIFFSGLMLLFSSSILNLLQPDGSVIYKLDYIIYFSLILGLDAISAIPFAKLRLDNRPIKFAAIRIINIVVNVLLNIFFLVICPELLKNDSESFVRSFFDPSYMIGYIFIANLSASAITLLLLYKEIIYAQLKLSWKQLKPMLIYGLPLMLAGFAGMANETIDRILLKYLLPGSIEERLAQVGIYNAAYKLSIFMTLAIQSFRMAAEPFFFSLYKQENAKDIYARVMNYFVAVCAIIFLGVMLHINLIQLLIGDLYREGLNVVPVLLLANLFLGIYLNLSVWYKVTDKTNYGIWLTLSGAAVTLLLNFLWIPLYGYTGAAYATLLCYFTMAVLCYLSGQNNYKVPYNLKKISGYIFLMLIFYFLSRALPDLNLIVKQLLNSFLFLLFVIIIYIIEKPSFAKSDATANH